MVPSNLPAAEVAALNPQALFITGSGAYVNSPGAPRVDLATYALGIPILGICYGMQRMAVDLGGVVGKMSEAEEKLQDFELVEFEDYESPLFPDFIDGYVPVWMAHNCKVAPNGIPEGFFTTGSTDFTEVAAFEDPARRFYGIQFHPEHVGRDISVQAGSAVINNFLQRVCEIEL